MALRKLTMFGAAVAAGAVAVLLVPSVAWANTNPPLSAGQTGKDIVASDSNFNKDGQSACEGITHTDEQDAWVFNWPGNAAGDLVSVHIGWDNTGDHTADVFKDKVDGTKTSDSGTLKFVIITPHGWRLESGASEITGSTPKDDFVLTHTCAGTVTPTTTTTTTTTTSTSSDGTTPGTPGTTTTPDGNLPVTGTAIGGIVIAGVALIGGGAALLFFRRRRDAASTS